MALPLGASASLAKDMAKKGIMGSMPMGEPKNATNKGESMGSGDEADDSPEKESAMEGIASDMMDAIESKDASALASLLQELMDRGKGEDDEDDEDDSEDKSDGADSSSDVRSPTSTKTKANTTGNFTATVTGGAGKGATTVNIAHPKKKNA